MNFVTAMTSAPRGTPTIEASLACAAHCGFSPVTVFYDHAKKGSAPNFGAALRHMLLAFPDAEAYVMLQDDIELALGLAEWIPDNLPDFGDVGAYSLYCNGPNHRDTIGWHEYAGSPACGALAYVIPNWSAHLFVAQPPRPGSRTMTDLSVLQHCRNHGLKYLLHSPSLVRHIGTTSTISRPRVESPEVQAARQCAVFCNDVRDLDRAF